MSLTTLDENTALIVVDLQKGIASIPCAHPMEAVVENASALAAAFRKRDLPVVLVNVVGAAPGRAEQRRSMGTLPAGFGDLLPELDAQPTDHLVSKRTWGAFTGTDLCDFLTSSRVTQVVICGVATSIGVESTARQAHELGFNVALAVDAMTDMSAEAHANSIGRIFPRLGETDRTRAFIDQLHAGR